MTFNRINSLSDALIVRRIRNECRAYLTNNTGYISILQQIYWYFTYYRRAARAGTYRIFVAQNSKSQPVGYGALHRIGNKLLVTECVVEKYRGRGYGQAILKELINIANHTKLPLGAEIRSTNIISIILHEKWGFTLEKTKQKSGYKLLVFKKDNHIF